MTQVISFEGYVPVARYDSVPWFSVRIDEADASTGPWTQIDEITLDPVDADPSQPLTRNITTALASDEPDLWYRLTFVDAAADSEQPTTPVQNTPGQEPYASVNELARILKIRNPTDEQTNAMRRVLVAAAGEINAEIDRAADDLPLTSAQLALVEEVNLERAVEHWRQEEAPFGLVGLGDAGMSFTARDSWERHALKLAPAKTQWGFS